MLQLFTSCGLVQYKLLQGIYRLACTNKYSTVNQLDSYKQVVLVFNYIAMYISLTPLASKHLLLMVGTKEQQNLTHDPDKSIHMHFNMLLLMKCPLTQPVPLPSCSHIPVLITSQICGQRVRTLSKYIKCYLPYLLMVSLSHTCKLQEAVETEKKKSVPTSIDYSTLQRGHQYFMEGYVRIFLKTCHFLFEG